MDTRCPTSTFKGIARLNGYKWQINQRGYANIVELPKNEEPQQRIPSIAEPHHHDHSREVWGAVYELRQADEAKLDVNEGVPVAYTKEYLCCDFWKKGEESSGGRLGVGIEEEMAEERNMLVYINRRQMEDSRPKEEYVYRMNEGIRDALGDGVPEGYVKYVMRRFIPEERKE